MSRRGDAIRGAAGGLLGALAMTLVMGLLRAFAGTSWPPELIGDRIAPLLPITLFNQLLVMAGGYNELKQLGVTGSIAGQLVTGALVGVAYALARRDGERRAGRLLAGTCLALWLASLALLWPVLDTSYRGLPGAAAAITTAAALLVSYAVFGLATRAVVRYATADRATVTLAGRRISRRVMLLGGAGGALALATTGVVTWLYQGATFFYDGLRYSGPDVRPITPNDRFYTVTKNVIDPRVHAPLWRLEIGGLVAEPRAYTLDELRELGTITQETTLMCISNSVGDGLMSNARWSGVPLRTLIERARPRPGVVEIVCRSVDSYSDTFAIELARSDGPLLAYEMNGEPLPDRHGYPVRLIMPGLFGEKSVKWLTRIELVDHDAKGFYESQGWGPSFVIPTHSRFDAPDLKMPQAAGLVALRGIAFAGDRGIRSVDVSVDDGRTWNAARLDYPGTRLSWALWSYDWRAATPGEHRLVVRATDGKGTLQTSLERGTVPEGATGYHRVTATIRA